MLRGEIRLIELGKALDDQASYRRPAVIVSNDGANSTATRLGRGTVTVIPLSFNADRVYPFQVLLPTSDTGFDRDMKAQAEHIRSYSVEMIGERVGSIPSKLMRELEEAIQLHLSM